MILAGAGVLCAQEAVIDRAVSPNAAPTPVPIERGEKGFVGDWFRIGVKDETWIIDSIRVWALAPAAPACPANPGDAFESVVLLGALDNPPVPGQPTCDCHALLTISTAPLVPGTSKTSNPNVKITPGEHLWQIDFQNLHWSLPGAMDVLFAVRAKDRPGKDGHAPACSAEAHWSLAASVEPGHLLKAFDNSAKPLGFAESSDPAVILNVRVAGHRAK